MNINKLQNNAVNLVSNCAKELKKLPAKNGACFDSAKVQNSIDALAVLGKASVNITKTTQQDLPEFFYHLTSKKNYSSIINSGKIRFSDWEQGQNGLEGIYLIDKNNFLTKWLGRKETEVLGDIDIGEMLLNFTNKDGDSLVAIKIPSKELDISKLRFRPYIKMCKESLETINPDTLNIGSDLVKKGLGIEELGNYINTKEPIEYIYQKELPKKLFDSCSEAKIEPDSIDYRKIAKQLFDN